MSVIQVKILWQGFTGAPGYTTLNFLGSGTDEDESAEAIEAADAFATTVAPLLANGTSLTVQAEAEVFDEATGELLAVHAVDPAPSAHVGASGAQGPLPTGAVISWTTPGINRGRKVRGRTYIVPLSLASYQSDGTLLGAVVTTLTSAATALVAHPDSSFGVWSRPRAGAGGAFFGATTWRVPDMAAVLRSRRD